MWQHQIFLTLIDEQCTIIPELFDNGLQVMNMKKMFFCACAIMLLAGLTAGSGKEAGEIGSIDSGKREVIVNLKSGANLKIGDMLEVDTGNGKITLEVTYPMQTVARCKIKGSGKLSVLKKGMPVFIYSKDAVDKKDNETYLKEENTGGIEMIKLPGGTFTMGSTFREEHTRYDYNPHSVTLSPFYIGKYEVTQKQYTEIMGDNRSPVKGENLPANAVSWYEAIEFCNKLSVKYNLKPYYGIDKTRKDKGNKDTQDKLKYNVTILGGNGFRLPTEAEWEYACMAGGATLYCYGDSLDSTMANFDGSRPYNAAKGTERKKVIEVGSFKPNAWGLYDVHGNVMEWCWDWYDEEYYKKSPAKNPKGPGSGEDRVLRGGSWYNGSNICRASYRMSTGPSAHLDGNGFRVARSVN